MTFSGTGQQTATMRQPYFSFLPHFDVPLTRRRCVGVEENRRPSSFTRCAVEDSAVGDLTGSRLSSLARPRA